METEDQLSARYEAELAAIAALDRRYYSNSCPSCCERADYAARQDKLHALRARFLCRGGPAQIEQVSASPTLSLLAS